MHTIIDDWNSTDIPPAPALKAVVVDPRKTALLVLDFQTNNCNADRRPRCVDTVPGVGKLIQTARSEKMPVVYSLTSKAGPEDILDNLRPRTGDPVVKSGVDKFFGTDLAAILDRAGAGTVIIVGTAAEGAVLHTATGAAARGIDVVVPVDGLSSSVPYAEQYTVWHLANAPGTRKRCTLTRTDMISF